MQDAFEKGDLAETLIDKAVDSLNIDMDSIEKEDVFINYQESPEKMAENIRLMYSPDCPHKGFDKYMWLFNRSVYPPKKDIANLFLAMNVYIQSGKKSGRKIDRDIYNSFKMAYKPSIWQRIKKILGF